MFIGVVALFSGLSGYGSFAQADALPLDSSRIINVAEEVNESVVGIICKISPDSKHYSEYSDNIGFASGIIYKRNGFIITNAHVVEEMESMYVVLSNKRVYEAYVVAVDVPSDLALIKINKGMLKPVVFADSSEQVVGSMVLVVGTPLEISLQNSVSFGIISGINRVLADISEHTFFQTDASANPGNSGGPVVNLDGGVVGIVMGGYEYYQGLTFVIPSNTIKYVMSHFEKYGYVKRPYIGSKLVQSILSDFGLPSNVGLTFVDVEEGLAVDNAGIKDDDELISINGRSIENLIEFYEELYKYLPGDTIQVIVERDGKALTFSVTLGEEEREGDSSDAEEEEGGRADGAGGANGAGGADRANGGGGANGAGGTGGVGGADRAGGAGETGGAGGANGASGSGGAGGANGAGGAGGANGAGGAYEGNGGYGKSGDNNDSGGQR